MTNQRDVQHQSPAGANAAVGRSWTRLWRLFNWMGPFLGLLFVVALFSIDAEVREYFLSIANFRIILTQTVVVAIGALGMTLVIVSGGIDLSVGSIVALCSVVGALLIGSGYPPILVVAATLGAGGFMGLLNGSIISFLRMNAFIVTLGMLGIARGLAKFMADNQTVNYGASPINDLMAPGGGLPTGVWLAIVLAIATGILMQRTVFGRRVFAIGSNESTARLCGVRVQPIKASIYAIAGLFFGTAGLMQLARLRQGDPTVAIGLELDVIAAVVIGGGSLSGGSGSVLGSMIGALIMAVLRNGSQQMGWPTYMQEIIIGAVIVAAVGLDQFRQTRSAKTAA